MSFRRTIFLVLLLAAVISFYYYRIGRFRLLTEPAVSSQEKAESTVFAVKKGDQLNRIRFMAKPADGETQKKWIALEMREDRSWFLTEPIQAPADVIVAEGYSALLRLSPRARVLSFKSLSPKEYGFDRPRQKICVNTQKNEHERCLLIGADGLVMSGAYAKWEDEEAFFLVSPDFIKAFEKSVYAVRQKQVFAFNSLNVASILVRFDGKEMEFIREKNNWMVSKPVELLVSSDAFQKVFVKLNQLYAKDFVDDADIKELGFTSPSCVIQLRFEGGSEQTLVCGREVKGSDAYYVKNRQQNAVYLVAFGKIDEIKKIFHDFVFP